jgi:hypothetical protein
VEEVASDDQAFRFGSSEKVIDAVEVTFVIPDWHGQAMCLKGGCFPQVNIGKHQRGMVWKKKGLIFEQLEAMSMVGEEHG